MSLQFYHLIRKYRIHNGNTLCTWITYYEISSAVIMEFFFDLNQNSKFSLRMSRTSFISHENFSSTRVFITLMIVQVAFVPSSSQPAVFHNTSGLQAKEHGCLNLRTAVNFWTFLANSWNPIEFEICFLTFRKIFWLCPNCFMNNSTVISDMHQKNSWLHRPFLWGGRWRYTILLHNSIAKHVAG